MTEMREFHIGDVLSITTGLLVSPRHMAGVYDILDYMEGWSHFTHQLGDAAARCKEPLLKQYPELAGAEEGFEAARWQEWLDAQIAAHGEHLAVAPACSPPIDPIESLCDKVGAENVYVVHVPGRAER